MPVCSRSLAQEPFACLPSQCSLSMTNRGREKAREEESRYEKKRVSKRERKRVSEREREGEESKREGKEG